MRKKLSTMQSVLSKLAFLACAVFLTAAQDTNLTDPTRPPGTIFSPQTYSTSEPLQVTAIFIYPTYRLAIINGALLKTGDHIEEFVITNIQQDSVELIGPQGKKEELRLTLPVKQPAGTMKGT